MTQFQPSDREVNRVIRSWLHEDRQEDVSRIAGVVLYQLDTTPQRRITWWPARRTPDMNKFLAIGLGAAAVVAVLLIGSNLLGSGTNPPGGAPSDSVSPSQAPSEPAPSAWTVQSVLAPSLTVTVLFGSAVPVKVGVFSFVVAFGAGLVMVGAVAGGVMSTVKVRVAGVLGVLAALVATAVTVWLVSLSGVAGVQVQLPLQGGSALTVPTNALMIGAEGIRVAMLDTEKRVRFRAVKIGRNYGQNVEVLDGLTTSDEVVLNPSDSLAEGDHVVVAPQQKTKPQAPGGKASR